MYIFSIVILVVLIVMVASLNVRVNLLTKKVDGLLKRKNVSESKPELAEHKLSVWGEAKAEEPEQVLKPTEVVSTEEAGGRWLGKVGIVAIVLGVSFFLKWAFDNDVIGEMGRIALGVFGGLALIGLGQFLRKKYLVYSDIISGGGIAVLYLTIFAASQFYNFISLPSALILTVLVTALAVVLSVIGGTEHLAAVGIFGGFLTPFLMGFGKDNFVGMMSYTLVLDLLVLGTSIFKKWNKLNFLGLLGTGLLYFSSYTVFYRPDKLAVTFLFLTLFFCVYFFAGFIHNLLWKQKSSGLDLGLITLNAGGYAFFAYALLQPEYSDFMGFFMLILACAYATAAFVTYRMNQEDKILNFYLAGLAVVFLTLVMPLQFTGHWITLAWLSEAALLVISAGALRIHVMNTFGVIVYFIGLIRYFGYDSFRWNLADYMVIFNRQFFLLIVAIIVAYLIGYIFWRHLAEQDSAGRKKAAAIFFILAHALSLYAITSEINRFYGKQQMDITAQSNRIVDYQYFDERQQTEYSRTQSDYYAKQRSLKQSENTFVSIAWALYAFVLIAFGFATKRRLVRILGMTLFFITAVKVLIDVWQLGEVYRIISSISFGVLALIVSFVYAKFKNRIKEIL